MADLMAIVSKAVFEKAAGKSPALGARLKMDRYTSSNKNLDPLAAGGRLYLVTVRPPTEALWLVAILERPKHDGEAWVAKPCDTPITDISKLRSKIKFESGVGITAKAGALGMSLQTPRALTAADTALLDAAAGAAASAAGAGAASAAPPAAAKASAAPLKQSGVRSASLIDAVLADPDNDDARRVYADLLSQHGDPRGEFILIDIALDGPLSIRKRAELDARRAELLKAHGKTWFPYALAAKRVRHGFLHTVIGAFKQIKTAAAKLFDAEPVVEVQITDIEDEETVEKLVEAKWLAKVRRLVLRGQIGDEGFASLCASPHTANLTALNVTAHELGAEALDGLGAGLPRCTTLVLTANPFGDDGLTALRRWKHLAGIETLYLSGCELTGDGVRTLLDNFSLPRLDKLCLTNNEELGDEGAGAIVAAADRLPRLRHLELANTGISESAVAALRAATLPALRRIDLRRNDLDEDLAARDPRLRVQ
jgi:uncharacterized protein (TIGR02996 family)